MVDCEFIKYPPVAASQASYKFAIFAAPMLRTFIAKRRVYEFIKYARFAFLEQYGRGEGVDGRVGARINQKFYGSTERAERDGRGGNLFRIWRRLSVLRFKNDVYGHFH